MTPDKRQMDETEFLKSVISGQESQVEAAVAQNPGLIYAKNDDGLSAVLLAVYYGYPGIARVIAGKGKLLDIYEASAIGDLARVTELTNQNSEIVNSFSSDGFQALGLACYFGHLPVAEFLLSRGSSIDTPSRNGLKVLPLQSAVAGGHYEIARVLLGKGAEPNIIESGGYTPLHAAAVDGDLEMVRLLLEYGARRETRSDDGKTAYDLAEQKGHKKVFELLRPTAG